MYDTTKGNRLAFMCAGDSITVGFNSTTPAGYRNRLVTLMSDYLGLLPYSRGWETNGSIGPARMCGASGLRTDEIRARTVLQAPAYANDLDCVFLHAGTNDTTQLSSGGGPNTVVQSMGYITQILDDFRSACPNVIVFIATIVDNQTYHNAFVTYNTALIANVTARADYLAGKVVIVDQYTNLGLWSSTYFSDATHPNTAGYERMADAWFASFITKF